MITHLKNHAAVNMPFNYSFHISAQPLVHVKVKNNKKKKKMCIYSIHADVQKAYSMHFVCIVNFLQLELVCLC